MGVEPSSSHFTDIRSSGSDPNSKECGNPIVVTAYPVGMIPAMMNNMNGDDEEEGESGVEPRVGLEFETADEARDFYSSYADRTGFKIRTGQLYRSRTDGTVSSRRFVCSKEGFQLNSRTGCPALIKVQRRDSGKWVVDLFLKDHNHDLGISGESPPPPLIPAAAPAMLQAKQKTPAKALSRPRSKPKLIAMGEDGRPSPSGIINIKRLKRDGESVSKVEPFSGLEFNSANEAYQFYQSYAASKGFRIRIGQLFRSKLDGSITSRRFVCSKEGFQHPSRLGCGAFMRIKRQESGKWVVDRLQKGHNHELEPQMEIHKKSLSASKRLLEEDNGGLENDEDIFQITHLNNNNNNINNNNNNNNNGVKRGRENHIGSEWYRVLFEYFQNRQSEDMSFFYAAEVEGGNCMSVFWADGRSRFSASQFGDAVILDTSYRKSIYLVPFASFVGINHHKQPVLLACALIADESEETFTWLFQTWLKATSGLHPISIIADQDKAVHNSIKKVLPRTHHRFSLWQLKAKENEYLNLVEGPIRYEYEKSVYQSQTVEEFEASWNAFLTRYGLLENPWLKEMYSKRESWVPAYLRGTFFAGIPLNEAVEPFFGSFLNAQTPLPEFVSRYERSLERRREEERKEDFNSYNLQAFMQTKEPMEEQCRRLYTLNVFKLFQKELLQSYSYLGFKIHEEASGSRYLVRKGANDNEKCIVTFNASNLDVVCSCGMFEFEGLLCRHALRVLQILDVRDVPSRYVLHRWTRNAEHGAVSDFESARSSQELKGLMVWSLRETASKYIEAGAASFEKHKLAYEIMREGGRKLCWQR